MTFTDEQLATITKLASIFLPLSDIALYIGVNEERLRSEIAMRESAVSKAYFEGKIGSKVQLFGQEIELARVGSPLAIENASRNLLAMEDDE